MTQKNSTDTVQSAKPLQALTDRAIGLKEMLDLFTRGNHLPNHESSLVLPEAEVEEYANYEEEMPLVKLK